MTCEILFSGENKKIVINLLSAEFAIACWVLKQNSNSLFIPVKWKTGAGFIVWFADGVSEYSMPYEYRVCVTVAL